VVICGLDSGSIKIWDAFDLGFLSEMKNEKETSPSTWLSLSLSLCVCVLCTAPATLVVIAWWLTIARTRTRTLVTALGLNSDFSQLFVGHANGALVSWSPRRMSNPAQLIKNLTLGRRKVTPLSSTSSTSVAIRKASRDLFEREAAAELQRLVDGTAPEEDTTNAGERPRRSSISGSSSSSAASSDSESEGPG
jgi:hypothetical protein